MRLTADKGDIERQIHQVLSGSWGFTDQMAKMADVVEAQVSYIMTSWYAARLRFKDMRDAEVPAGCSRMWRAAVERCISEIRAPENSSDVTADERHGSLLQMAETSLSSKFETMFS